MVEGLREIGLELESPEGTFYLLPKSPTADSRAFVDLLAARDVFVLPGSTVELPGYFRISLTATDDMIERSLPGFAAAFKEATA
jgi:aspartate aminotransferase